METATIKHIEAIATQLTALVTDAEQEHKVAKVSENKAREQYNALGSQTASIQKKLTSIANLIKSTFAEGN